MTETLLASTSLDEEITKKLQKYNIRTVEQLAIRYSKLGSFIISTSLGVPEEELKQKIEDLLTEYLTLPRFSGHNPVGCKASRSVKNEEYKTPIYA